ncbi:MAG: hypothetical protein R3E38_13845 [Nitrosomonas sp.]|nr:hypothetical protein [Nitrosomonas sp.]
MGFSWPCALHRPRHPFILHSCHVRLLTRRGGTRLKHFLWVDEIGFRFL